MCGICGDTRDPTLNAVEAMNAAMVRRGPDDDGTYVDEKTGVALGARRLSIIDVEGGHQPLSNEDGTIWAVLNGEIYNHPRLQELLRARGHTLRSRTDTEVLVHLYEDHGDSLVHALEGMYAFAVWDTERRRLLVARDRMGEKPLFYRVDGSRLQFASELTPLLRAGAGDELDPTVVDDFFVFGYVASPASIVRNVRQLPPGHRLVWEPGASGPAIDRYWSPPRSTERGAPSVDLLSEEVRALLEQSVRSRLISDVPLGVFLSGGLDSTLIAALAAQAVEGQLRTFTVGYDTGDVSELEPARQAARALGTDHRELVLSEDDVVGDVPRLFAALDQPLADQALAPLHAVARLARESVTVAVGGEGADELFAGYPRYRWLARAEAIDDAVPAALRRPVSRGLALLPGRGRWRRMAEVLAPNDSLTRHLDWVTDRRRHRRTDLYGERLRDHAAGGTALDSLEERVAGANGSLDAVGRFMRLDLEHWLPDDILAKADRAGMLASLEIRTPFLQRELAELALTTPSAVHTASGSKTILRNVLSDVAEDAAWSRSKTAFRVPVGDWLRGGLGDVLDGQTQGARLYSEGWFDAEAVRAQLRAHRSGDADSSSVLWPLLSLGCWYEAQDSVRGG
jgi:asparagine synthase (glutamine-hydrolysing)